MLMYWNTSRLMIQQNCFIISGAKVSMLGNKKFWSNSNSNLAQLRNLSPLFSFSFQPDDLFRCNKIIPSFISSRLRGTKETAPKSLSSILTLPHMDVTRWRHSRQAETIAIAHCRILLTLVKSSWKNVRKKIMKELDRLDEQNIIGCSDWQMKKRNVF